MDCPLTRFSVLSRVTRSRRTCTKAWNRCSPSRYRSGVIARRLRSDDEARSFRRCCGPRRRYARPPAQRTRASAAAPQRPLEEATGTICSSSRDGHARPDALRSMRKRQEAGEPDGLRLRLRPAPLVWGSPTPTRSRPVDPNSGPAPFRLEDRPDSSGVIMVAGNKVVPAGVRREQGRHLPV